DAIHPHEQVPFGGFVMASAAAGDGVQNEPPRDVAVRARAASSASAVVVTSASMRERAVFIGGSLFGTPLGHLRRYTLILLQYFRHCIATVERREASVPRHSKLPIAGA